MTDRAAAQVERLGHYEQLLDSQRAALRMGDAGLVEALAVEADAVLAGVLEEDARLRSATGQGASTETLGAMRRRVEAAARRAASNADALLAGLLAERDRIVDELDAMAPTAEAQAAGYAPARHPAAPALLDATG